MGTYGRTACGSRSSTASRVVATRCSNVEADGDDVPVPVFGLRVVCTAGGMVGADARPNWGERRSMEVMPSIPFEVPGRLPGNAADRLPRTAARARPRRTQAHSTRDPSAAHSHAGTALARWGASRGSRSCARM